MASCWVSVEPPQSLRMVMRSARRIGGANIVDAAVLEEATVFDGDDGLDHARWNLVVGDETALGAVLVFGECGDELWLELVGG